MKPENAEDLGKAADDVDNLIHAMMLPMPAAVHLQALRESMPALRDRLRTIYIAETGEDPW